MPYKKAMERRRGGGFVFGDCGEGVYRHVLGERRLLGLKGSDGLNVKPGNVVNQFQGVAFSQGVSGCLFHAYSSNVHLTPLNDTISDISTPTLKMHFYVRRSVAIVDKVEDFRGFFVFAPGYFVYFRPHRW